MVNDDVFDCINISEFTRNSIITIRLLYLNLVYCVESVVFYYRPTNSINLCL